jgi:hypothetical protein
MSKWTALYYPNIEPPTGWLRSAALFFDTVTSFVPAESESNLSDELREFSEATQAWTPYRPTESTALLSDVPVERLDNAFGAIAAERPHVPGRINVEVVFEGSEQRMKGHVFMHGSKLSPLVRERLNAHHLMLPKALAGPFIQGDWWIVDEEASNLILSHIADRLAAQKGWTSVTDNENCYAFNAIDWVDARASEKEAEDQLARVLVSQLVPDEIEELSIAKYVELRCRYEPIRKQLATFTNEVVIENRFSRIGDSVELGQAIEDYVKDLRKEVQAFRESTFGRTIRKWGAFSLGGVATVAATLSGHLWATVPLAGATIAFGAADKAALFERKATKRGDMVRLVAGARSDIIRSSGGTPH